MTPSSPSQAFDSMTDAEKVECWLPVLGYEGIYEVSDKGRVRSLDREVCCNSGVRLAHGRDLKLQTSFDGYRIIHLCKDGEEFPHRVHVLVLEAFGEPKPFDAAQCNHKDGDKKNNHPSNLEWVTSSGNKRHALKMGLHKMEPIWESRRGKPSWNKNPQDECSRCKRKRKILARGLCSPCYVGERSRGVLEKHKLFQCSKALYMAYHDRK